MEKEKKKQLREQYENRHPQIGIAGFRSGEDLWIAKSKDIPADYNSALFQLKLGSWRNKEMQAAFAKDPDSFEWVVLKELKYEDPSKDFSDDLEILYLECLEEYPGAKGMRPGKR